MTANDAETAASPGRGTKVAAAGVTLCLLGFVPGVIVPHPLFAVPIVLGLITLAIGIALRRRERRSAQRSG
jgi:hypothetical protein